MKKIKQYTIVSLCFGLIWACSKPENEMVDENFTKEDVEIIRESSQLNMEHDNFEGVFVGKIKGLEVELSLLEDFEFKLKEGGKSYQGEWEKLEDGTRIELQTTKGTPKTKFYALVDANTWIALDKDGEFLEEKEEFLKRN